MIAIQKKKLSSTVMEARIREEIKRRKLEVNKWILMKHIIEWDS
jgi:hypothetical protein